MQTVEVSGTRHPWLGMDISCRVICLECFWENIRNVAWLLLDYNLHISSPVADTIHSGLLAADGLACLIVFCFQRLKTVTILQEQLSELHVNVPCGRNSMICLK